MRHLAPAWLGTARRLGASGDAAQVGADLLARYAEPHRHFHDLAHLDTVLRHVDELAAHAEAPDVVRMAAWFHDAVYDPRAADNEERSAHLAEKQLAGLRMDPPIVAEVARLVRATATHAAPEGDRNAAALFDADLAVLGADPSRYAEYVDGIRAEFGHLDSTAFARGRAEVLRGLLGKDPLFATPTARDRWEQRARKNLSGELAGLQDRL